MRTATENLRLFRKSRKKVRLEISARFCNKKYSFDFTGGNHELSYCFVFGGRGGMECRHA